MKHSAFAFPPCCAMKIPALLKAIQHGQGDDYLGGLCPECRTGKGIVIDLVDRGTVEEQDLSDLLGFGEETGFCPRILTMQEDRAAFLAHYQEEVFPSPLRVALEAAQANQQLAR